MTVDIYIAPAVAELTAHLSRLPAGEKNVVFCEDRLTLEAERAVARAQGVAFDTRVTTFARFIGEKGGRTLSKQGSVLAVAAIAARLSPQLRCFGKNPTGCAEGLYETIAQLRAALVTPEMLDEARAEADPVLAGKLADIALVYREYLAFLAGGYLDESGVLALLPSAMEGGALDGANVVFAGFSSFTCQAGEGIRAAAARAKTLSALFLGGDADAYTNEAVADFEKFCARAGLSCRRVPLPFTGRAEADIIRKGLFNPLRTPPMRTDRVCVFEGATREEEIAFIAAAMRREVQEGARWRDLALFLPDFSAYSVALEKTFSEYKIPYFSDAKKSLAQHPAAKFALGYLALLRDGYEPADADAFLGSPFFGFERRERDEYRNYLLKYANYRGGLRRPLKEGFERFEPLRARALAVQGTAKTAGEYCRLVRALLERFDCASVQESLAHALEEQGLLAEASYLRRGIEELEGVLAEAEELAGGERMRPEEFSAALLSALTAAEVALIPQYADAVYVGSLTESKLPRVCAVFAAGLTADVPAESADAALISDRDIDRLRSLRVEIAPKIREVNARARENAALALCGFSERLYLTYPVSAGGKECRRGEIAETVRGLFCTAHAQRLPVLTRASLDRTQRTNADAYARYLASVACERAPAVRELLLRADEFRRGKGDFSAHAGLYEALRARGEAPDALLFAPPPAPARYDGAAALLLKKETVAPTFVEGFFTCPYRNFAERGLLLREREEQTVRRADTGNFLHEVLRRLACEIASLSDIGACAAFVRACAEDLLAHPPYSYLADTAAGGFAANSLVREAVIVGANVFEQIRGSSYAVESAEASFGYPNARYGGIPLGGGLTLAGKIDRVDGAGEYVRVIDYKSGAVDTGEEAYYTGRKVQLETYLSAAAQGRTAAGAYYFPARAAYAAADEYPFRMKGLTDGADEIVRLSDTALQPGEKSRFIDAAMGKKTRSLSGEDFADLLAYGALVARECVAEIRRGVIAASPYREACAYCPYGGLCGFDPASGARKERSITKEEIVQIVRKRRGDR